MTHTTGEKKEFSEATRLRTVNEAFVVELMTRSLVEVARHEGARLAEMGNLGFDSTAFSRDLVPFLRERLPKYIHTHAAQTKLPTPHVGLDSPSAAPALGLPPAEATSDPLNPRMFETTNGKLLVAMALVDDAGVPFITGRLFYEVVTASGLAPVEKDVNRRAGFGARKLRKLCERGLVEEKPPLRDWPVEGNSPIRFYLTTRGLEGGRRAAEADDFGKRVVRKALDMEPIVGEMISTLQEAQRRIDLENAHTSKQ